MHTDPVAKIAAQLTRVQVEVMTSRMYRWEVSCYERTAKALIRLDLITPAPDHSVFLTYRFTALGKKVRAHLLKQKFQVVILDEFPES